MSRLLHMNFQSSKFKLKNFVNSCKGEMNPTSYSIPPKVMCHMVNFTSTFGGGPQSCTLLSHWIGEHKWNFLPRPQSSRKIFFWIVGIQASSQRCLQVPMPEIKDYCSTLAASKLIILIFRDLGIFKNTFPKEQFFVKESKESFELFYFQHEIFKFNKIIQKTCLGPALVLLQ